MAATSTPSRSGHVAGLNGYSCQQRAVVFIVLAGRSDVSHEAVVRPSLQKGGRHTPDHHSAVSTAAGTPTVHPFGVPTDSLREVQ